MGVSFDLQPEQYLGLGSGGHFGCGFEKCQTRTRGHPLPSLTKCFETASGLKVNIWKSGLCGVNASPTFLEMACTFLICRIGSIPFKYLGLPIGANPKRLATWEPLLEHLRGRLCSWRNKHISLGGRIVIINAVLNAIPIFYLSFMKMPVTVRKMVVRIQREFLWGGVRGGNKINWVKWSVVCKKKCNGGLGVRDVRIVDLSLLAKWRWRFLQPGRPLWKVVLMAKYGNHISQEVDWSGVRIPIVASNWWKDICSLDEAVESKNWLADSIGRKLGNGLDTKFWTTKWMGNAPLALLFPRLFSLSNHKEGMVADFSEVVGEDRGWSFSWRRELFRWEEDLVVRLREILAPAIFSLESDKWVWTLDAEGNFSVNSAYNFLLEEFDLDIVLDSEGREVLEHIWDSPAPSKVIAFSWQLLLDRIPTRGNLVLRGIPLSDVPWECVGCAGKMETSIHLFLFCPAAMLVWSEIFKWLGVLVIIPPSLSSLFEARNASLFANGSFNPKVIADDIKILSWKWSLARVKMSPCMFYEWTWDPGDCLQR
ncbi:hypothetical protein TSUD_361730 [Trifolium subterraneum]|uniref:Reverse transcriptase zinc-binding domain-containing protein n=1 Tax=Trifolium subterraneum TaxID=3900 RepID=A0A2Z6MS98_TRISU|nr:hypothetical protein TSUD_361730 [Trifolium subterraneum]